MTVKGALISSDGGETYNGPICKTDQTGCRTVSVVPVLSPFYVP